MESLLPVRCYTCGKVIGDKGRAFDTLIERGKTPEQALDVLGLKRYCCRKFFISTPMMVGRGVPEAFVQSEVFKTASNPPLSSIGSSLSSLPPSYGQLERSMGNLRLN